MARTPLDILPLERTAAGASRFLATDAPDTNVESEVVRGAAVRSRRAGWGTPLGARAGQRGKIAGEVVIALVCVTLLGVCYASLAWYGFDLLEEGYFLVHARRVQLGGLPYRDFSTPYTPGVFYLYAWLMDWVGIDLIGLRVVQIVGRAVTYLALYGAARRLMAPGFALLAPAILVAMDTAPELWGIHPGWITAAAATAGTLAVAQYLATGKGRWLIGAGLASGIAFAFKQNLAVYGLIAALWFLVVAERRLPPVWTPRHLRPRPLPPTLAGHVARGAAVAVQVAALLLLPLTAAVIVRPYFSPFVAMLYVLPLASLSVFGATRLVYRAPVAAASDGQAVIVPPGERGAYLGRLASLFTRPLLVLLGFAVVTLPWLWALIRALDGRIDLLGGFVGRIDPSGYFYGMKPFTAEHARLVGASLLPPLILVAACKAGLWGRWGAALLLAALLALAVGAGGAARATREGIEPWSVLGVLQVMALSAGDAWAGFGNEARVTDDLILYLPLLAFWAGLAAMILTPWPDHQPVAQSQRQALRLWYLTAGAALFLNQYPRMDEIHFLWSAGVLLIAGADVLHDLYRRAVRTTSALRRSGAGRAVFAVLLTLLPTLACLPHVWVRLYNWTGFAPPAPAETHAAGPGGRIKLAPLAMPVGGQIWLREEEAAAIQEVVDLIQVKTAPGEPIFTYPAIPGFAYLADRPIATRFLHLFAGMATAGEQEDMVRDLEAVRYVVWDDGGAHYWVQPGDNPLLTEYVRTHFRVERFIGPYTVLARDAAGPQLPYTLPTPKAP